MCPIHSTRSPTGSMAKVEGDDNKTKDGAKTKGDAKAKKGAKADPAKAGRSQGGLGTLPSQAGGGDVLFVSRKADKGPVDDDAPTDDLDLKDADGGDDGDATAAGGMLRALTKGAAKLAGRRSASSDAAGDGADGGADGGKSASKGADAAGAAVGRSRGKRGTKRGDKAGGKKGAGRTGGGGGPRMSRAEGREKNEAVEQVSVLVGQEDGGDAVEQALAAQKRIMGDDERKNAFTSEYHDTFDPALDSTQVQKLGSIQGAVHMVRLADHWEQSGLDRDAIIQAAAKKLLGFEQNYQVKKVLGEMTAAPIKQVYPLEVMIRILDERPDFLPKTRRGKVLDNRESLAAGERILTGHEFRVKYPADYKIKSFALLGGGQPGYEFAPHKNGIYRMIIDTPGEWTFALSAYRKGETVIDTFTVKVNEPGPVSE